MAALSTSDRALAARYDREAGIWHGMLRRLGYFEAYDDLAAAAPELRRARSVLDVGCGSGAMALAAWKAGARPARFDLLDASERMLEIAAGHLAAVGAAPRALHMDLAALAVRDERYDAILSAHLIEHLPDAAGALALMRRALAPGGLLILSVSKPHWCTALVRLRWGSRAWREAEVLAMLAEAGFASAVALRYRRGPPSRTSLGYLARA